MRGSCGIDSAVHDPLESLDAALMLLRDYSRRRIAATQALGKGAIEASAPHVGEEGAEALWRYEIANQAIEDAFQLTDRARLAWRCLTPSFAHFLMAAERLLFVMATVSTPEQVATLSKVLIEEMNKSIPAPAERGGRAT